MEMEKSLEKGDFFHQLKQILYQPETAQSNSSNYRIIPKRKASFSNEGLPDNLLRNQSNAAVVCLNLNENPATLLCNNFNPQKLEGSISDKTLLTVTENFQTTLKNTCHPLENGKEI
jgi:hypothetical protein